MFGGERRRPRAVKKQQRRGQRQPGEIEQKFHGGLTGGKGYTILGRNYSFFWFEVRDPDIARGQSTL